MSSNKIYSFKASGKGSKVSGRICASDMNDATKQVLEKIKRYGQMSVQVTELKNQKRAMQEWEEDKKLMTLAESRKNQKRIRVNINDL